MKSLLLAITLLIFHGNSIDAIGLRAKRGLSPKERHNLMEELYRDRRMIAKELDVTLRDVTYSLELEKTLDNITDCDELPKGRGLRFNEVGEGIYQSLEGSFKDPRLLFFDARSFNIGCSKTFKCTSLVSNDTGVPVPPMYIGATMELYGACIKNNIMSSDDENEKIAKSGLLPSLSKYADLIGVPAFPETSEATTNGTRRKKGDDDEPDSSGRAFSLILSLFLVFYV